jgi:polyisoprenoid-binding protein YceI
VVAENAQEWRAILKGRAWGVALLATAAFGQQVAVDFDKAATKIAWILVGNVHTVHGAFQLKHGAVIFDPANGSLSGELVVEADSGDSGSAARDKRMKKEVLETDKFPEVRLRVTKLEGALAADGASNVRLSGQLTIHGASHEVSIPLQVTLNGRDFSGKGKFVVPYVDWGMKDPSNFLFKVNKSVEIDVEAAGRVR